MALFTFGEGYHNYHRQFQHDYRNDVKPWQWYPTKWLIWILSKLGLTSGLRRVPEEATVVVAQCARHLWPDEWQADGKHDFSLGRWNRRKCLIMKSAPERIRTTNLLIRSQMLYPVELRAQITNLC
jgi:hypothetical protein